MKTVAISDLGLMALADRPPHPNAARLFVEWLTSQEGQAAIVGTGRPPASTKVQAKYPDLLGDKRVYVTFGLAADLEKDSDFWRTTLGIK